MKRIKKLVPKTLIDSYHYPEALLSSRKYGNPSAGMIIIGVVGSKGKTTTANMLWSILDSAGYKTGQIGTANIRIGQFEELNKWHMTMPGTKILQNILSKMNKAGCRYVVMEVPSEGQTQWRHIGINFDMLIFTNVEREILAAHGGSMDILHRHNRRVFDYLSKGAIKTVGGKTVHKQIVYNSDRPESKRYIDYKNVELTNFGYQANDFKLVSSSADEDGTSLTVNNMKFHINLVGKINALNATGAIAAAQSLGVDIDKIKVGLDKLKTIPGRMEKIDMGQNFTVFVDYAHDPASMTELMETGKELQNNKGRLIVLFGGQGGGRDIEKRQVLGNITGKAADIVIISDDDPYDDDPQAIIEDIAKGARAAGKKEDKDLYLIADRRDGIRKALEMARKGDIVFIACKGADQLMMLADGRSIPWDDRKVTSEELSKILG